MEFHGDAFCIKTVKQPKIKVIIPSQENFDFGKALSSVYPLLDCVFEYLSFNDLISCSKVNRLWKDTVQKTLSRRTQPSWFTCYKVKTHKSRRKANVLIHSNNLNYNNIDLGIILYDANRLSMNKFVCVHTNTSDLCRKSVPEYLEDELIPKSVDYCVLSVARVVSSFNIDQTPKKILIEASTFDGLFIPKIANVKTVLFHCDPSKKTGLEETIKYHIKCGEEVKCLLVFSKKQLHGHLYSLLKSLIPRDNMYSVALGGGVIRGTKTFQKVGLGNKIYSANDAVCIGFLRDTSCKEDNFNAYSWVIPGQNLCRSEFIDMLQEFRSRVKLKNHSLGFRICCSSKCQEAEETQCVSEVFPGIPVIGLEAYGEIGWNCCDGQVFTDLSEPKPKKAKKTDGYPVAENYWSTILVILTWD